MLMLLAGCGMASSVQAAIPVAERQALLALYDNTDGDGWFQNDGWNDLPGTECVWYGVTCDKTGSHVTAIALAFNYLDGSLPDVLTSFSSLESFDVNFNDLAGTMPSLAGLSNLRYVDVSFNDLSGAMPTLSGLENLSEIHVQENQFDLPGDFRTA